MRQIVILGSGHAALSAVRELRAIDQEVAITLLTRESGDQYYKPNLSKALSMHKSPSDLVMKTRSELEAMYSVRILSRVEVTEIDRENKQIAYCDDGGKSSVIVYGKLVLATGASPIDLQLSSSKRILSINTLDDYRTFRAALQQVDSKAGRVAIIGAGFVGVELASDLCSQGYSLDLIDTASWPLNGVLPQALGEQVVAAFPDDQLGWYLNRKVMKVAEQEGRVVLLLDNGESVEAELVISAVGLSPNTDLAEACGLQVNRGIVTDACLRTSDPHIFALGDCAETLDCVRPFIAPATQAAKVVAQNLCGQSMHLQLPGQAVAVKNAYLPLVICPSMARDGWWEIDGDGQDLAARYSNALGLQGFSLSGEEVNRKSVLAKLVAAP